MNRDLSLELGTLAVHRAYDAYLDRVLIECPGLPRSVAKSSCLALNDAVLLTGLLDGARKPVDVLDVGSVAGASTFLFDSMGRRFLGYPISCHDFRYSAATTILTKDPRNIRMASGVLSHGSLRTVNQFYDQSGDAGSRRIWGKMRRDIHRGKGVDGP